MRFPTDVLRGNIIKRFESVDPDTLRGGISAGKLSPEICYHCDRDNLRAPYSICIKNEIHLDDSFLAFVWSFIYATWVLHEEGSIKTTIMREKKANIAIDHPLLSKCEELLSWSHSLPQKLSSWPSNLPSPSNYQSANEKYYGEKVNGIFQDAVVYLLYHEVAHLVNGHCPTLCSLNRKLDLQEKLDFDDQIVYKGLEKEADQYAFEKVMTKSDIAGELSVLFVNCAILFLLKTPNGIVTYTHPDTDFRIQYVIESIKSENLRYDFYTHLYATEIMLRFFNIHKIPYPTNVLETVQDLFVMCLNVFDGLKQ